jgi:hypothetical protein
MTLRITPEKTVPYPESLEPEVATTLRENMQIAANTAAVLKGLGAQIDEDDATQQVADEVFKDFAKLAEQQYNDAMQEPPPKNKGGRPKKQNPFSLAIDKNPLALERPSVAARIGTMLSEYNNHFVADAAQMRLVVTNKLLDLASCGDPRIEIKATEMLGKISDVGLFSEKTEITVTYNKVSDLDEAIKDKIRKMMRLHAVDVPSVEIDVTAAFGRPEILEDVTPVEEPETIEPGEESDGHASI